MTTHTTPRIILLTAVHYHATDAVCQFLTHVAACRLPEGWTLEIALADNSGDWDHTRQLLPGVHLYSSAENTGYLNGCAYAFAQWSNEHQQTPEWVGVVNTDLEFADDFFERLLTLTLPAQTAVIAPDVRLENGMAQNPFLRQRPRPEKIRNYTLIYRHQALARMLLFVHEAKRWVIALRRAHTPAPRVETMREPETIYAPHGSAIFLQREYFARGGVLNYGGFLYCEEYHIAEQARRLGLQVVWTPGLTITHHEHTTMNTITRERRRRWAYESNTFIWQEYFRAEAPDASADASHR